MNARTLTYCGFGMALVIALLVGTYWQHRLTGALARVVEQCPSRDVAWSRANAWQQKNGGGFAIVLGTGSMAPLIPEAAPPPATWHGTRHDWEMSVQVAFAVTVPNATFADVRSGSPCVYRPKWNNGNPVFHEATEMLGTGWIMTGLNNDSYEKDEPMHADIFMGIAARVFTWPQ